MDFIKESLHKANNCAIWWLLYALPTIYGQHNAHWIKVGGGHNIYNNKLYLYVICALTVQQLKGAMFIRIFLLLVPSGGSHENNDGAY